MQNLLGARSESKSHQSGGSTLYTPTSATSPSIWSIALQTEKACSSEPIDQRVLDRFQDFVELQVVVPERKRTQCLLPLPFRDVVKTEYQTIFAGVAMEFEPCIERAT